ncbi:hypothetical protein RJT34_22802 [Clitoria ternatea]|uniref:Uncharacterized protein n=1 Tax=Clitoria ternatea TaxID=43366 RepID=A0AAN9FQV5_CLITE
MVCLCTASISSFMYKKFFYVGVQLKTLFAFNLPCIMWSARLVCWLCMAGHREDHDLASNASCLLLLERNQRHLRWKIKPPRIDN